MGGKQRLQMAVDGVGQRGVGGAGVARLRAPARCAEHGVGEFRPRWSRRRSPLPE